MQLQLSNPNETPKMELYALHVSPGLETTVNILPYISDSDDSLRSVPMPKRKCYFNGEKYLEYYRYQIYCDVYPSFLLVYWLIGFIKCRCLDNR